MKKRIQNPIERESVVYGKKVALVGRRVSEKNAIIAVAGSKNNTKNKQAPRQYGRPSKVAYSVTTA